MNPPADDPTSDRAAAQPDGQTTGQAGDGQAADRQAAEQTGDGQAAGQTGAEPASPADDGEGMERAREAMLSAPGLFSRISTKLYASIGVAVLLTLAASLVGWFSFIRVDDAQSRVNDGSVPELVAAFGVAQYSGLLTNVAPSLAAANSALELFQENQRVTRTVNAFGEQLDNLIASSGGGSSEASQISENADTLLANIAEIQDQVFEAIQINEQRDETRTELTALSARTSELMLPALDDQIFYTFTGRVDFETPATDRSEHFSETELLNYRRLAELEADAISNSDLLTSAFVVSDASLLVPLRERFEAAASRIDRNLLELQGTPFYDEAAPTFIRLRELGLGDDNTFQLAARAFEIRQRQTQLLNQNNQISLTLLTEVDSVVRSTQERVAEATSASEQAITTAQTLLLAISAVSIVGALFIVYFYVGKLLVQRIAGLSDWMRRMAGGDLEATESISGRDEIANMAATLEVFRRHALEVQRLNLVEQLAAEVQGKNKELEGVLAELQKAQDQIVTREKLAALGELTAGVAHEIKNPLNFVKNFAEASQELISELKELLEDIGEDISESNKDYVNEIAADLTGNIERIRSHGERADRIVRDMLMMGRDSGEWQLTDINGLLEQHAQLSFHSARAMDPDFQLDIQKELDPEVGELRVIAQDLGRVFLNMVTNAGHATSDRGRVEAATGNTSFQPTLWLKTKRLDDHVEVCIRDNGTGMPPDVIEKIFNPFFTTKETNQGTGLGLSISSDIVRRHGGSIAVESEPGEFTEMCVTLPLISPSEAEQAETASHAETETTQAPSA
ncbi:MAG: ATP-binding protein [Acidimicrobiaceae bacterium]|nr:ATP-binding protein [Acidimicrobiaceae bacterium]